MSAVLRQRESWPHPEASRFVEAGGLLWHIQVMGQGPAALLLHGTGASTHSWRGLMPLLARRFTVIAPDLPGMGQTSMPPRPGLSLSGMAASLRALVETLGQPPELVVGHSAGVALAARLCLDGAISPRLLVSINGAILPLGGWAGQLFAPMARMMVALPGVPRLFAWRAADRAAVEALLANTGSKLDAAGIEFYARLFRSPQHVEATLGMMAQWDLPALQTDLPRLRTPVLQLIGKQDRTIRPTEARRLQALLPGARIVAFPGLGHLAHEEAPQAVADAILEAMP
jgi:magnesium chelatase accessory protein